MTTDVADPLISALNALIPTGATRGEINRGGRALRWVEAGSSAEPGSPTIVLECGAGTAAVNWAGIMPALAARTRVIAYDRAGYGRSDRVAPLTLDVQVGDLAALLAEAGGGPCVVVGHSWGGMLAETVAWSDPARIAGLVLVDPGDERFLARISWWERAKMSVIRHYWVAVSVLGLHRRAIHKDSTADARRISDDPDVRSLLAEAMDSYYATHARLRTRLLTEKQVIMGNLGEFARRRAAAQWPDVPVTLLSAGDGPPIAEGGMRLADLHADTVAAVPGARHIVVPDSGHFIHYDQPAVVLDAILDVLSQARRASSCHPARG